MKIPNLPAPEFCCYCVEKRPQDRSTYHLYLKMPHVNNPPGYRRYEINIIFYQYQDAMAHGEELVRVFSMSGLDLVHNGLYTPEIYKR